MLDSGTGRVSRDTPYPSLRILTSLDTVRENYRIKGLFNLS